MAKNSGKNRRKQTAPSYAQTSAFYKELAREANKTLGTKFNTRKKALSKYAVQKINRLSNYGLLGGEGISPAALGEKKLTAIPVNRKQARAAKKAGWEVVNNRIVVKNDAETVKRVKRNVSEGKITGVQRLGEYGMEVVILPFGLKDIRDLIQHLEDGTLNSLKHPDEFFAFKFFGYPSHRVFRKAEDLAEYLTNYKSILDAAQDMRVKDMVEQLENFELVRLDEYPWPPPGFYVDRPRRGRRKKMSDRERAAKLMKKVELKKAQKEAATGAERMRKLRAKETPEETAERKRKDALRHRQLRDRKLRAKLEEF